MGTRHCSENFLRATELKKINTSGSEFRWQKKVRTATVSMEKNWGGKKGSSPGERLAKARLADDLRKAQK